MKTTPHKPTSTVHRRSVYPPSASQRHPIAQILGVAVVLLLAPDSQLLAQTFKTLYSFTEWDPGTRQNTDGSGPNSLLLSGNTLYGTAGGGGSGGSGTVFALNADGTGFTNLYSFTALDTSTSPPNNADGAGPTGLILSGNTLYGLCLSGGAGGGAGTVFALNTDGTGFSSLYQFTGGADGSLPQGGVTLLGSTLYGATYGLGGVFAVNTDGTGFTDLYSFTSDYENKSELILSGHTLYGTTSGGGIHLNGVGPGFGTVFNLNTDGTGFTALHQFSPTSGGYFSGTNWDGAIPGAGLVLSGGTLYGTTSFGGARGSGTVFCLNTNGECKTLHSFAAGGNIVIGGFQFSTNADGLEPLRLILSGSTLYGATLLGGPAGAGTVFKLNTDGTGFTTLYYFTTPQNTNSDGFYTNNDGASPTSLTLSGRTLYGTAGNGGSFGSGTIFSIALPVTPPQLTLAPAGANVVLMWSTNFTGFTLQSTTNLASPVWTAVSPAPVVVNGQNTVTNPVSGTQQFYRLSQ